MPEERTLAQPFGPILEGIDSGFGTPGVCVVCIPEAIYVRQGGKVHFFKGTRQLTESVDEAAVLVENFDELELEERIDERTGKKYQAVKDGLWVVEGPYQRSDTKNTNGRTYGRPIWERLIADPNSAVQESVRGRGMVGHLEHPKDGRMDGKEGGLLTTSLKLRKDGVVWGVSELMDTPNGFILQEYTKKKVRWGVSSRGNGSVDSMGRVNERDYALVTFDGVLRPSVPGAFPTPVHGAAESAVPQVAETATQGQLDEAKVCTELVDSLRETDVETLDESLRTQFTADLVSALSKVNSLAGSPALPLNKARELQDWLTTKLKESHDAVAADAETIIEEELAAITSEEDGTDGSFARVVSDLEARLLETAEEAESLRTELEAAQVTLQEAEAVTERLESERDAAQLGLAAAKGKLAVAEDIIAEQSTVEVEDAAQTAVDEAVKQVPTLERFRDVLETATTPERVMELAEELLPVAVAQRRTAVAPPLVPAKRCALPSRGLQVASDVKGGKPLPAVTESQGARTAGKALKKMGHTTRPTAQGVQA